MLQSLIFLPEDHDSAGRVTQTSAAGRATSALASLIAILEVFNLVSESAVVMLEVILDLPELLQLSIRLFKVSHEILVDIVLARGYMIGSGQLILTQPVLKVFNFTT